MNLSTERHAEVVVLRPAGRVDHQNADAFSAALAPHLETCKTGGDRLLLDLSGIEYISSAGLRVLMIATKRTKPMGGLLAVAAPAPTVREILEITRFDLVFPVHGTVADGIAALRANP